VGSDHTESPAARVTDGFPENCSAVSVDASIAPAPFETATWTDVIASGPSP
jgi:hypothetical protein